MTLFELYKRISQLVHEFNPELPVTLVVVKLATFGDSGEYDIDQPLHDIVVGKDAVHLISKDV